MKLANQIFGTIFDPNYQLKLEIHYRNHHFRFRFHCWFDRTKDNFEIELENNFCFQSKEVESELDENKNEREGLESSELHFDPVNFLNLELNLEFREPIEGTLRYFFLFYC